LLVTYKKLTGEMVAMRMTRKRFLTERCDWNRCHPR